MMIREKIMLVNEKILWAAGGAILVLLVSLILGGIYTITPPNGPVDSAYKINRFTGKVWLIKTYSKPVGNLRVLAAREAVVEPTKDLNGDAELSALALQQEQTNSTRNQRR
ncbi:MAG TPA: hypothetical protein VLJ79_05095 [Candidatus Binatia bacterium]|nr:hypothetical protein [Candidatus Binatia bacterium]